MLFILSSSRQVLYCDRDSPVWLTSSFMLATKEIFFLNMTVDVFAIFFFSVFSASVISNRIFCIEKPAQKGSHCFKSI